MLEPSNTDLSLSRQCKILSISRSSAYYRPKGESAETLALMRRIDPEHRVYSYKLRKLSITRPNHVWCTDITYIPMQRGFRSPPSNRWRAGSPGCDHGLGDAACAVLAAVQYARHAVHLK